MRPVQIAYHVADPALAAAASAAAYGWGPFFLFEHIPLARASYRGRPMRFDHTSAYGQAGELMVEFITQHDDAPSPLRDAFRRDERGVHHIAHLVADLGAAIGTLVAGGAAVALDAETTDGVRFAMLDTRARLGHMTELYEPVPALTRFYDYVRRKAVGWDGRDPVRRLGARTT
ncbi:MAG: VOC family protein [Proteobacteria bacterium]|nr:VOC family protein [Pseudomonadota bacterium]